MAPAQIMGLRQKGLICPPALHHYCVAVPTGEVLSFGAPVAGCVRRRLLAISLFVTRSRSVPGHGLKTLQLRRTAANKLGAISPQPVPLSDLYCRCGLKDKARSPTPRALRAAPLPLSDRARQAFAARPSSTGHRPPALTMAAHAIATSGFPRPRCPVSIVTLPRAIRPRHNHCTARAAISQTPRNSSRCLQFGGDSESAGTQFRTRKS